MRLELCGWGTVPRADQTEELVQISEAMIRKTQREWCPERYKECNYCRFSMHWRNKRHLWKSCSEVMVCQVKTWNCFFNLSLCETFSQEWRKFWRRSLLSSFWEVGIEVDSLSWIEREGDQASRKWHGSMRWKKQMPYGLYGGSAKVWKHHGLAGCSLGRFRDGFPKGKTTRAIIFLFLCSAASIFASTECTKNQKLFFLSFWWDDPTCKKHVDDNKKP